MSPDNWDESALPSGGITIVRVNEPHPLDYSAGLEIRPRGHRFLLVAIGLPGLVLLVMAGLGTLAVAGPRGSGLGNVQLVLRVAFWLSALLIAPALIGWFWEHRNSWVARQNGVDVMRSGTVRMHVPWHRIEDISVLPFAIEIAQRSRRRKRRIRLHWTLVRDGTALCEMWEQSRRGGVGVQKPTESEDVTLNPAEGGMVEERHER